MWSTSVIIVWLKPLLTCLARGLNRITLGFYPLYQIRPLGGFSSKVPVSLFTCQTRQTNANTTLEKYVVPKDAKPILLRHLRRLNITCATLFANLDHVAKGNLLSPSPGV